ncbi:DUF7373 family lipoprotein [Nocardia tengchongensis]|uniref:DUF7373 family lipoprotein n=1 Tax=Nocardia tengchongensis TaxID=2055889 RepID=UPI00361C1F93
MKKINRRRAVFAAAATSFAVLLAGCGSTVSGSSAAGEIDVRTLAVGNYPTTPLDLRATYEHSSHDGAYIAAGRLADAVVSGADVDPSFSYTALARSGTSYVIAAAAKPVLDANHLMLSYSTTVSDQPRLETLYIDHSSGNSSPLEGWENDPTATTFNVTVMQFPGEQQAQAAAEGIESADFGVAPADNARVSLDKYPAAKAHWRPGIPSMAATLSRGQYAINVFVRTPKAEIDGLKSLATKIFDAQLPLLDKTPPLSQRDILYLDYDPADMLRRTLHPGDYPKPSEDEVTRTPRGFLHTLDEQAPWKRLLDDNGVDMTSSTTKGALLLRARDPKSAVDLWSGIKGLIKDSAEAPPGLSAATCAQNPKPNRASFPQGWDFSDRYVCTVYYDRYVARVGGPQLLDAQQRAAAQYALLAKAQYL